MADLLRADSFQSHPGQPLELFVGEGGSAGSHVREPHSEPHDRPVGQLAISRVCDSGVRDGVAWGCWCWAWEAARGWGGRLASGAGDRTPDPDTRTTGHDVHRLARTEQVAQKSAESGAKRVALVLG
ncbi:hypothetical protein GCM10010264_67560 [Streptomyces globisporus]|nr:hypothetical protein GCM10010264_67560 [Streptomyces globisporus]